MDAHVRVQRRRTIEGFATDAAAVRFLRRVDDLVSAESGRLPKALTAHLRAASVGKAVPARAKSLPCR